MKGFLLDLAVPEILLQDAENNYVKRKKNLLRNGIQNL